MITACYNAVNLNMYIFNVMNNRKNIVIINSYILHQVLN